MQPGELGHLIGHERLTAEARLHGHHEDLVELVEHVVEPLDAGCGLDGDTGAGADLPQPPGEADRIGGRLEMEGDGCRAELGIAGGPPVGIRDHEVHIQRNGARGLDPLDHLRAEGEVRHEVVVHHVDVHEVGGGDAADFGLHVHEVGGQDAGVDADAVGHQSTLRGARGVPPRCPCDARRLRSAAAQQRDRHGVGAVAVGPQLRASGPVRWGGEVDGGAAERGHDGTGVELFHAIAEGAQGL